MFLARLLEQKSHRSSLGCVGHFRAFFQSFASLDRLEPVLPFVTTALVADRARVLPGSRSRTGSTLETVIPFSTTGLVAARARVLPRAARVVPSSDARHFSHAP